MPTVNERCKILRSVNRVYVFHIVLLLVPKDPARFVDWDFGFRILRNKEAQECSRVPKKQTTTRGAEQLAHYLNSRLGRNLLRVLPTPGRSLGAHD